MMYFKPKKMAIATKPGALCCVSLVHFRDIPPFWKRMPDRSYEKYDEVCLLVVTKVYGSSRADTVIYHRHGKTSLQMSQDEISQHFQICDEAEAVALML